jgi:prepilin-type N-terminal cleavage/methylation domain-containing protein
MKRKAFTLIELLVVISIIALLMAILMPALGRARDQAKKITCSANLRSLAQATLSYVNDNKDYVPYSSTTFTYSSGRTVAGWVGCTSDLVTSEPFKLEYQIEGSPDYQYPTGIKNAQLWPYLESTKCWRCPADQDKDSLRSYCMSAQYMSNKYDSSFGSIYYDPAHPKIYKRMSEQRSPSNRFLFIDCLGRNADAYFALWYSSPMWWNIPNFKHSGGTVNGYADGHIEQYKFEKNMIEEAELAYEEARTGSNPSYQMPQRSMESKDLVFFQRAVWGEPGYDTDF